MSIKEENIAILSMIPDELQEQIFIYLSQNYFETSPFSKKTAEEIYRDLEESRNSYERGEYQDFDSAIDEISLKYGL